MHRKASPQGQGTAGSAWAVGTGRLLWGPADTQVSHDCLASLVPAGQGPAQGASSNLCTQLQREVGCPEFLEAGCASHPAPPWGRREVLRLALIPDACAGPHAAGHLTHMISLTHTAPPPPVRWCSQAHPGGADVQESKQLGT